MTAMNMAKHLRLVAAILILSGGSSTLRGDASSCAGAWAWVWASALASGIGVPDFFALQAVEDNCQDTSPIMSPSGGHQNDSPNNDTKIGSHQRATSNDGGHTYQPAGPPPGQTFPDPNSLLNNLWTDSEPVSPALTPSLPKDQAKAPSATSSFHGVLFLMAGLVNITDRLVLFDLDTNTTVATYPIPAGNYNPPLRLAIAPDGQSVWFPRDDLFNSPKREFVWYDLARKQAILTVPVPSAGKTGWIPSWAVLSKDGKVAYLMTVDVTGNLSTGPQVPGLMIYDTVARKILKTLSVQGMSPALSPDGRILYIADRGSNLSSGQVITIIDTVTNTVAGSMRVSATGGDFLSVLSVGDIAVHPTGRRVYMVAIVSTAVTPALKTEGRILVFDAGLNRYLRSIPFQITASKPANQTRLRITRDGRTMLYSEPSSTKMTIFDLRGNSEAGVLPVTLGPGDQSPLGVWDFSILE
jgi:hypothetical protein